MAETLPSLYVRLECSVVPMHCTWRIARNGYEMRFGQSSHHLTAAGWIHDLRRPVGHLPTMAALINWVVLDEQMPPLANAA